MKETGFGRLTADLLERRSDPAPAVSVSGETAGRERVTGSAPRNRRQLPRDVPAGVVPAEDRVFYSGPERRKRDVSPVVERRRNKPPRIKTTVRLEPDRYEKLRLTSALLNRTHQDLITSALDFYLARLNVHMDAN